ncbi:hypothetical protein [Amycolatopsis sp. w19]|uniref:hypothetical protein n=1 Tax=Amycolatopsis sp. w19 TaxID=3448134 RepID=UPI003F192F29
MGVGGLRAELGGLAERRRLSRLLPERGLRLLAERLARLLAEGRRLVTLRLGLLLTERGGLRALLLTERRRRLLARRGLLTEGRRLFPLLRLRRLLAERRRLISRGLLAERRRLASRRRLLGLLPERRGLFSRRRLSERRLRLRGPRLPIPGSGRRLLSRRLLAVGSGHRNPLAGSSPLARGASCDDPG